MKKVRNPSLDAKARGGFKRLGRHAASRIEAGDMHQRMLNKIAEGKPRAPRQRIPSPKQLEQMLEQALAAMREHPDSIAAQKRFRALAEAYERLYG